MQELKAFYAFQEIEKVEDLFGFRLWVEQAQTELKQIKEKLDAELIRKMKEKEIVSFEISMNGLKNKIYCARNDKDKIVDPERLHKFLTSGTDDERALAARCLSYSASAWKISKVKELCDTLGIEHKEIIETVKGEKIEVKILPIEMLEKKGVI